MENKICNKCNQDLPIDSFRLRESNYQTKSEKRTFSFYVGHCRECERQTSLDHARNNKSSRKARRDIYWQTARYDIKKHISYRLAVWKKKTPEVFNLTTDYLYDLYNQQNGNCFYTNRKMIVGGKHGESYKDFLSLDRLFPEKGYVKGNVVWCTYFINTMKGQLTYNEFHLLIKDIINNLSNVHFPDPNTLSLP